MADDIENEGAIDTGDQTQPGADDNSGGAPAVAPAGDDNSGAAPVAAAPGGQEAIPTQEKPDLNFAHQVQQFPGNLKRIVSYLSGEGAVHPSVLDQAAAQVDPQGERSPGDRNLLAVDDATQRGGKEAGWKMIQANRVAYNAKQAFAYAALQGGGGKPPDINAAVQAANQADEHVLDGSSVEFSPSQGGVTATVTQQGATAPKTINLTKDQFAEYLHVGKSGQWDKLMQPGGIPATLEKLAQHNTGQAPTAQPGGRLQRPGQAPQPANQPAPQPQAGGDDEGEGGAAPQAPAAPQGRQTNFGQTPSTQNLSGNQDPIPESEQQPASTYTNDQEQRSRARFPWASQEGQRQASMQADSQREDELENKLGVAEETGKNRIKAAEATGVGRANQEHIKQEGNLAVAGKKLEGYKYSADHKQASAQIAADAKAAAEGNKDARARIESSRKAVAVLVASGHKLTPAQDAINNQIIQAGGQQQAAPQQRPQQAAPQQKPATPGQPPVPGARNFNGKWYTRGPNGESVPVQ